MRLTGKSTTFTRTIALLSFLFLFAFAPAAVSPAAARTGTAAPPVSLPRVEQFRARNAELQTVLSVIEHRTRDGKVLEKMQKKLATLGERELHLAASLCERISPDDHSAGASIAFSIVTAMIVLS